MQPNRRSKALPNAGSKKAAVVDAAQSKDIMGEILNELDLNEADDLAQPTNAAQGFEQVVNADGQVAMNKHEEMQFKAANVGEQPSVAQNAVSTGKLVPSANPFSKKRQFNEMQSAAPSTNGNGTITHPKFKSNRESAA